jgi:histidine ammonia-lyase/tyrosine ammonia-lyase
MPPPLQLLLGPDHRLTPATLESVARADAVDVRFSEAAESGMREAREALASLARSEEDVYGVTTGFGPLVDYAADENDDRRAGGLLAHLGTGAGDLASPAAVRATMAARLQTLAQGASGVSLATARALARLLESGLVPAVPEIGSLGASGDLTPLAHVARALVGVGRMRSGPDATRPAEEALADAGLEPASLEGRDALALVNGTSFTTAYAALGAARADRLAARAEQLTGWAYRLLGCSLEALDARLHAARGHAGQAQSAAAIHQEATRGDGPSQAERPLQEPYSLRCAPQILGAVRDQLAYVKRTVTTELNGVDDNPVLAADASGDGPEALHGGNFQAQHVAFAADALNAALTQAGVLAERQVDLLLSPDRNGGAPPLLAWTPGRSSGLAGAQLTATALVAEMRHNAQSDATSSIPTNNDNQDVVSMGALAARSAHAQTDRLAHLLAVLGLALAQLTALREAGRADGPAPPPPDWMPEVDPVVEDRALRQEIDQIAAAWLAPDGN